MASQRSESKRSESGGDGIRRRSLRPRSDADLISGLVFIAFGVAFGVASLGYELGSLRQMGPGYAPLLFAVVLIGLGVGVVVKAYVAPDTLHPGEAPPEGEPPTEGLRFERLQWRPVVFITAAPMFFAFTVDGLGLLPATFGCAAIAGLAARNTTLVRALVTAAGLTLGSYVVFVVLLQLRLPLLGDWLG